MAEDIKTLDDLKEVVGETEKETEQSIQKRGEEAAQEVNVHGTFELMTEENVSAGTRRIIALTGGRAEQHRQQTSALLDEILTLTGGASEDGQALAAALLDGIERHFALAGQRASAAWPTAPTG